MNKGQSGKGGRGFTLIELMVVLAIIGILAAMAIPAMFKRAPHYRLISTAGAFQSDLEFAQQRAIAKNAIHCLLGKNGGTEWYQIVWDCNQDQTCDAVSDTPSCTSKGSSFLLVNGYFPLESDPDGNNSDRFAPGIKIGTPITSVYIFRPIGGVFKSANASLESTDAAANETFILESMESGGATIEEKLNIKIYATGVVEAGETYRP